MKLLIFFICYLIANAQTVLYERSQKKEEVKQAREISSTPSRKTSSTRSNLPSYFSRKSSQIDAYTLTNDKLNKFSNLFINGNFYDIRLISDVYAYLGEQTEVIAAYNNGANVVTLRGKAALNPDRESVNIVFDSFHIGDKKYSFYARGIDSSIGQDFRAKYHSNEATYFMGDLLSTSMAAYLDARVSRVTTPFGNTIDNNSVDSAMKKGSSAAFLESANRFKERSKSEKPFGVINANSNLTMYVITKGELR